MPNVLVRIGLNVPKQNKQNKETFDKSAPITLKINIHKFIILIKLFNSRTDARFMLHP